MPGDDELEMKQIVTEAPPKMEKLYVSVKKRAEIIGNTTSFVWTGLSFLSMAILLVVMNN